MGETEEKKIVLTLMYFKQYSGYIGMCIDALSRFSQAGQIFVSHSSDPLVDVVEVDQEELSMSFQLLLVGFGFWLKI